MADVREQCCFLRAARDMNNIKSLEANIAELQKALEGCDDSDELCEQKAARYNTWIEDIKVFAIQAREKIAEASSQLSALTVRLPLIFHSYTS